MPLVSPSAKDVRERVGSEHIEVLQTDVGGGALPAQKKGPMSKTRACFI